MTTWLQNILIYPPANILFFHGSVLFIGIKTGITDIDYCCMVTVLFYQDIAKAPALAI